MGAERESVNGVGGEIMEGECKWGGSREGDCELGGRGREEGQCYGSGVWGWGGQGGRV